MERTVLVLVERVWQIYLVQILLFNLIFPLSGTARKRIRIIYKERQQQQKHVEIVTDYRGDLFPVYGRTQASVLPSLFCTSTVYSSFASRCPNV